MGTRAFSIAFPLLLLGACGDGSTPHACTLGDTRCTDDAAETCVVVDGRPAWSSVACGEEQACRGGACTDPSAAQRQRADAVVSFVDQLGAVTAYPYPYDGAAIKKEGRRRILKGEDTDDVYLTTMWWAFNQIPEGHQGMSLVKGCGKQLPYDGSSRFGVCGRPSGDAVVVTSARADNRLGLHVGDRVVKVGETSGPALLDEAYLRPRCGGSYPSQAGRRTAAATGFFGTVPAGSVLDVVAPDGTTRTVTIPDQADTTLTSCRDPLGRSTAVVAEATTLPDGTAVIRVPSFVPFDEAFPTTNDLGVLNAYRERFQARIQTVFDSVKSAPRMIWDMRGNGGGLTQVALAIASGFPGAKPGDLTTCNARVDESLPPSFDSTDYATYALTPGGSFAYAGKVAVLIDGLDYSAADYFAYVVRHATSAVVVGSATAGAFGATSGSFTIDSASPALSFAYDVNRCVSLPDRTPLETKGTEPELAVEYTPSDLAAGKDTVLEAALARLGQ